MAEWASSNSPTAAKLCKPPQCWISCRQNGCKSWSLFWLEPGSVHRVFLKSQRIQAEQPEEITREHCLHKIWSKSVNKVLNSCFCAVISKTLLCHSDVKSQLGATRSTEGQSLNWSLNWSFLAYSKKTWLNFDIKNQRNWFFVIFVVHHGRAFFHFSSTPSQKKTSETVLIFNNIKFTFSPLFFCLVKDVVYVNKTVSWETRCPSDKVSDQLVEKCLLEVGERKSSKESDCGDSKWTLMLPYEGIIRQMLEFELAPRWKLN